MTSSNGTPIRLGLLREPGSSDPGRGHRRAAASRFGTSDDPDCRTDVFQTTTPAQFRSAGIRGAQRYISLQLDGPGTATIDYVRVRTEHLHPGPDGYSGYFLSNDRLLNRIWYASAYTFAMDSFRDLRYAVQPDRSRRTGRSGIA